VELTKCKPWTPYSDVRGANVLRRCAVLLVPTYSIWRRHFCGFLRCSEYVFRRRLRRQQLQHDVSAVRFTGVRQNYRGVVRGRFLPAKRYASAVCAVILFVCPSVCLSQARVLSKWLNGSSCYWCRGYLRSIQDCVGKKFGHLHRIRLIFSHIFFFFSILFFFFFIIYNYRCPCYILFIIFRLYRLLYVIWKCLFIVCLHVRLICALNYYLLTYLLTSFWNFVPNSGLGEMTPRQVDHPKCCLSLTDDRRHFITLTERPSLCRTQWAWRQIVTVSTVYVRKFFTFWTSVQLYEKSH